MSKISITINGKAYPCRQTMGAMLRFKRETGKELTEVGNNLSDMCTYLYCCVASACKHDKIPFDMELIDFADSLSIDDITSWAENVNGTNEALAGEEGGEKKS